MFNKFRKWAIVAASFTTMAFSAENVSAGYVCHVNALLWSGALGADGFVSFSVYSGVNCTGTLERNAYLCSAGATSSLCPSSEWSLHARDSLISYFKSLLYSTTVAQRITMDYATCNGGNGTCTSIVNFFGR